MRIGAAIFAALVPRAGYPNPACVRALLPVRIFVRGVATNAARTFFQFVSPRFTPRFCAMCFAGEGECPQSRAAGSGFFMALAAGRAILFGLFRRFSCTFPAGALARRGGQSSLLCKKPCRAVLFGGSVG